MARVTSNILLGSRESDHLPQLNYYYKSDQEKQQKRPSAAFTHIRRITTQVHYGGF